MFKSKSRPVIVPQSEHLRLAGELAFMWGNPQFELPPLPRISFVEGIALHDRGYGYLDNVPIGEADEGDWLEVTRKGFYMPASDPVADIVTRLHLRRLVTGQETPARRRFAHEMLAVIDQQISESGVPEAVFTKADRITDFCDRVSFDFCFERSTCKQVMVYPRFDSAETIPLEYEIQGEEIRFSPWPLAGEAVGGYLVGYQAEGYPETLEPVLMPYRIRPGDER